MSTRSRRSAGADAGALNSAMIQLFDTARLKKELESRGLSTIGQKQVLADRLYDAVVGNTPLEIVNPAPKAKPAPRRKSQPAKEVVVKEEVVEEEEEDEKPAPEKTPQKKNAPKRTRTKVKQEPIDPDDHVDSSPTVAKRARIKREPLSPSPEPERPIPPASSPLKRAKPVVESAEAEAAPQVKVEPESIKPAEKPVFPQKSSPQKSSSKKPAVDAPEVTASSPKKTPTGGYADLDEDAPLLSLLGPPPAKKPNKPLKSAKKEVCVKEEVNDDVPECSSSEQSVHQHGTRRSMAMKQAQSLDASKQRERMDLIQNSKLLSEADCDTSEDYVPPRKESHSKPDEAKHNKHPTKEERKKSMTDGIPPKSAVSVKAEPEKPKPPVERRKTIVEQWAEKWAVKKKENGTDAKPETSRTPPIQTPKAPVTKVVKPTVASKPQTAQSSGGFVLDDILTKQEELAMEAKKKKEREEEQQRAAEQRNREKMAEQRKKAAEAAAAKLAAAQSSSSSSSVDSPAGSTPMRHPYSIPKPLTAPHPYSIPQSLPPLGQKTSGSTTRIPPPPPPKKPSGSGGSSAVNSPATASPSVVSVPGHRIPPPPPKKSSIPPPPPPKPKKEPFIRPTVRTTPLENKELSSASGCNEGEVHYQRESGIGMSDTSSEANNLVDSVTRALLSAMARHGSGEESMDSVDAAGPSNAYDGNEEFEEYDPLGTSDFDVSAYVPSTIASRNQTMQGEQMDEEEEEEEYVPSDYEGDAADESEDSEVEEGPSAEESQDVPETKKDILEDNRVATGKDDVITVENLLKNPRDLLMKASAVLQSMNKNDSTDGDGPQYVQMPCADDYEPEEQEQKTPEYHGEPVPSDDDDLFEIAAGIIKPKKKKEIVIEEEKLPSDETIEPDYYNADLHIKGAVEKNWQIEPENADGLALMWGGVRSNYGIRLPFRDVRNCDEEEGSEPDTKDHSTNTKKIVFQVKITEFLATKHLPFEEMDPHDIRVGFSLRSAPNNLGEFSNSYCITSLGKKATNNLFTDFGNAFHLNDVITASLDLGEGTISYWKNEEFMGVAFTNISLPDGEAIFPHICIKNCNVAVNFGDFPGENEDNKWTRNEEWRFFNTLGRGDLERSPKSPDSKAACTVIIMVGLPGVGKTTWVREYLREHPGEQWTVINSEGIMAAMKVNGVSRKRAHQGRWDMVMGLVGKSLQRSVLLAARRRRNYILDMTNTSRDARKRRLQLFEEFRRKCVIIMPSDEDMADRQARQARQEGTAIMPPEAMLEMKAMISLPAQDLEPFEDIYFIEPNVNRVQDAIDQVARYNEEARPWFQKKYRRRRSQMIGLGEGVPRDNMQPRKFTQPLTVMPQLKVAVIPLDDPSNTGPSSIDSGPNSASLGFAMVDNSPSAHLYTPPASRMDRSVPPPAVMTPTGGTKPLVRVTITDDAPQAHVPLPFNQPTGAPGQPVEEEYRELDDDEIREVRESAKASSSNPMIIEAVMRAKLKVLLLKKKEKRAGHIKTPVATPAPPVAASVASPVVTPTSRSGTPIQVLGARTIPTIGAFNPITIDTAPSRNTPSPIPLMSPAITRQCMPSALAAPYLASPTVSTISPAPFAQYQPPGAFPLPPPPAVTYNMPLPGAMVPTLNVAPTSTYVAAPGFQQWSQPSNGGN